MRRSRRPAPFEQTPPALPIPVAAGALVLAILAVWGRSFSFPFVFDDTAAIVDNPTIRHLWPLTDALMPPTNGSNVTGRPLVNLSFALNYAISGHGVWSYHAFNVAIHAIASLALFGFVRRTLLLPRMRAHFGRGAFPIALLAAAAWALHPLQTESVTCVVQRTESLMGCLYLLASYLFVRGTEAVHRDRIWLVGSVGACLLGMATKEVMVTLPALLLLYDRTFLTGSFRAAWHARWRFYIALGCTCCLLGALVLLHGAKRGEAAGLGLGITSGESLFTQCRAITLYLQLAAWPHPLILDYGSIVFRDLREIWAEGVAILLLLGFTTWAIWRQPTMGFVGAWFVVILAPSSSFIPLVGQTIAEHRMYLPLAAITTLLAVGLFKLLGRAGIVAGLAAALLLGGVSSARNAQYKDPVGLWRDNIAKLPSNARAHNNLANLLARQPGRLADARAHYEIALRLEPRFPLAHNNLAILFAGLLNQPIAAHRHYETALQLNPDYAQAHNNFAVLLAGTLNRPADALAHYQRALQLDPAYVEAHNNLAVLLGNQADRRDEAIAHIREALRLVPDYPVAHFNLANLLSLYSERRPDAVAHYETALRLVPTYVDARNNLAALLATMPGRRGEAIANYEAVLRLVPNNAIIHFHFARLLELTPDKHADAVAHYSTALRLDPSLTVAQGALERLTQPSR